MAPLDCPATPSTPLWQTGALVTVKVMKGWQNLCWSCRDGFRDQLCSCTRIPQPWGGWKWMGALLGPKRLWALQQENDKHPSQQQTELHLNLHLRMEPTARRVVQPLLLTVEGWGQAQRGTINSLPSGTAPHPALCSESLTQSRHSSAQGTSKSHSQLPKAPEALCQRFNKRLQLTALCFLAFFYTYTSQGRVPSLPGHSSWLKGQPCPCLKASAPAPAHPPGYKADVEQR